MKNNNTISLSNPFDAHVHWRQLEGLMRQVYHYTVQQFSGSLLMPNTKPNIITLENLEWYKGQVTKVLGANKNQFLPIFVFYLSPELKVEELVQAWTNKDIYGVKYYPKGGTTGSDNGAQGFQETHHILEAMEKHGIPLLIHGETPIINKEVVDDDEREAIFMETEMSSLVKEFPGLNISLEHISTKEAVDFLFAHDNIVATVTPQHMLLDRRALHNGTEFENRRLVYTLNKNGVRPDMMMRPKLKHQMHVMAIREALIKQSKEGLRKMGLGTDSAPHAPENKYCECGACGQFNAPIALQLYASAFEEMDILDHLQTFAGEIMPDFYGIKHLLPAKNVLLAKITQTVDKEHDGIITPFAGQKIPWAVIGQ